MLRLPIVIKRLFRIGLPVTRVTKPYFSLLYHSHVYIREGAAWALRFFYYEPLFKSQCTEVGKGFWMEELPYIINTGVIRIGENVRLSGKPCFCFSTKLYATPTVAIGDDTYIGDQVSFSVGKSIVVGRHCLIAGGVHMADNDGHPLDPVERMNHRSPRLEDVQEVRIGNNVWIGGQSVILKGVTVGDRAVVGARSVVTKDVPPDTVVVGNPARVIRVLAESRIIPADGVKKKGE